MTALIGERYRSRLEKGLTEHEVDALWLPDNAALDPRLAGHADLSVFVRGTGAVVGQGVDSRIVKFLTNRGYSVQLSRPQGAVYPVDAGMCVCCVGRYAICNERTADPAVLTLLDGPSVSVAQGYTRCAAAVVDEHTIITADAGVSKAAKRAGLDVIDIAPGHIRLDGYDTGFIGGASFIIGGTMYFTGTLDAHPDRTRIVRSVAERGKKPVFLTPEPIFDIGGAILV